MSKQSRGIEAARKVYEAGGTDLEAIAAAEVELGGVLGARRQAAQCAKKAKSGKTPKQYGVKHLIVVSLVLFVGIPCAANNLGGNSDFVEGEVASAKAAAPKGFERLCGAAGAKFISAHVPIKGEIEIRECSASTWTVKLFPERPFAAPSAERYLAMLMRPLVESGYMKSGEMVFIHLRVAQRGETVTGAPGQRTISGAHYDFNTDSVEAK